MVNNNGALPEISASAVNPLVSPEVEQFLATTNTAQPDSTHRLSHEIASLDANIHSLAQNFGLTSQDFANLDDLDQYLVGFDAANHDDSSNNLLSTTTSMEQLDGSTMGDHSGMFSNMSSQQSLHDPTVLFGSDGSSGLHDVSSRILPDPLTESAEDDYTKK